MSRNIVEVHFSTPPEGNNITYYFVMTGLAGYVNAYPGIIQRPNAQFAFNPDRPLGQHNLQVRLVGDLQADREILIAYGARHGLKERKRPRPKLNKTTNQEEKLWCRRGCRRCVRRWWRAAMGHRCTRLQSQGRAQGRTKCGRWQVYFVGPPTGHTHQQDMRVVVPRSAERSADGEHDIVWPDV